MANGSVVERGDAALGAVATSVAADSSEPLWIIVPGEDVLITRVVFPTRNPSQARTAAPYLIEEYLVPALEDTHVVTGELDATSHACVAGVAHATMRHVIETLAAVGLRADHMVVDHQLMRADVDATIYYESERAIVSRASGSGFCCPATLAPAWLDAVCGDAVSPSVSSIVVYRNAAGFAQSAGEASLQSVAALSSVRPLLDRGEANFLEVMDWRASARAIDLLQGVYTPRARYHSLRKLVRRSVIASVAALVCMLAFNLILGAHYRHQGATYREAAAALFTQYFPEETRIVILERQVRTRYAEPAPSPPIAFLKLARTCTTKLAPYYAEGRLALEGLGYVASKRRLSMTVASTDVASLEEFRRVLQAEGLVVRLLSATRNESNYVGRLEIGEVGEHD